MQKEEQDTKKEYLEMLQCPSFNCYSSDQLASVADQVGRDYSRAQNDDSDFEFLAFREVAHEGVFLDDTVFPLFKRDLLRDQQSIDTTAAALRRSECDPPPSESSSSGDELEGVPAGTYCVWTPNSPQASVSRCKKSNSTGSSSLSKRWKLLDLLRRSNSDRKESFGFLTPSPAKNKAKEQWRIEVAGDRGEKKESALYVRNRELMRVDKKRSFLPYKTDLIGFCTTRLGKAFPSF